MSELIVFTDEDGGPWMAFVWGEADSATVTRMITAEAVEDATGFGLEELQESCSWPPSVKTYFLREATESDECFGGDWEPTYLLCNEGDTGAQRVTGHRFYYQG